MTKGTKGIFRKVVYAATKSGRSYNIRMPLGFIDASNKRFAKVEVLDKDTVMIRMVD